MDFFEVLFFLLVFGSLLFLAAITTRYVGGKAQKAMKGKYITIVETLSLGMDKKIHLLKVGEQYILVASSGKSVEYLNTINLDGVELDKVDDNVNFEFKAVFEKYVQSFKNIKNSSSSKKNSLGPKASTEEGIFKNNLDRLKKITDRADNLVKIDGDDVTNEK